MWVWNWKWIEKRATGIEPAKNHKVGNYDLVKFKVKIDIINYIFESSEINMGIGDKCLKMFNNDHVM